MRHGAPVLALILAAACGPSVSPGVPTSLSGHALDFYSGARVAGARVTLLELPGRETTTASDGAWRFDDLTSATDATPIFAHPDYLTMQAATFSLTPTPIDRVTFQVVTSVMFEILGAASGRRIDRNACQFATTVTRRGVSIYDGVAHGEAGATVTIEPPVEVENGPVYFDARTIPDTRLTETTADGGVLFVNLEPGDYVLHAHKEGTVFSEVRIKCHEGALVNASPPRGLQVQ